MGIYDDITQAESSGNSKKPNSNSSALGLGQFVKGTWLDMIRRYHPELAQDKSDAEILELRKDPKLSREMTENYAKENEAKLCQAGIPVTPGSTYLMHFAGPSGGIALMKADPNTPVESILSDQAIKANPHLQGKTASWVIAWANKKMADAAESSVTPQLAPWHTQQPIPYLAQTQAVEPAFGATNWPPRPASPNTLPPDAVRPFARTPSVAPVRFADGTMKAQQALDNSLPAPGAPPWAFSNRFGRWDNIGDVSGPTRSAGSNGPGQAGDGNGLGADGERFAQVGADPSRPWQATSPLFDASGGADAAQPSATAGVTRRITSIYPEVGPPGPNSLARRSGSDMLSGLVGSNPNALSFPPVWSPPAALLAPGRNRTLGNLVKPLPFNQAALPAQDAPGGIPGLLMQLGAFDPSHPDEPPSGGLLRLIQDYMRNNPDGGSVR